MKRFLPFLVCLLPLWLCAQPSTLDTYNTVWTAQSKNSSESMPCGGGDIGLNVWVENNELFFYVSRSGSFDENNALLKAGRVRVRLTPNLLENATFRQELNLAEGAVTINAKRNNLTASIKLWVDVFNPVVHLEINSNPAVLVTAVYENWRHIDRPLTGRANNANSWKWAPQGDVKTYADEIDFSGNAIAFYHRNKSETIFDVTVRYQEMESVKDQLFNPLKDLTFGGTMLGKGMKPAGTITGKYQDTEFKGWILQSERAMRSHELTIHLHTAQTSTLEEWKNGLQTHVSKTMSTTAAAKKTTLGWWKQFWDRSFIFIDPTNANEQSKQWQISRNYQLFRYMLACNAYGSYPTKFNGGLLTYDPVFVNSSDHYTPDFRNWGGGVHTAQNQRLVYFPMIKSGDFDMMKSQFDFYLRILRNGELRSEVYWGHGGACFTEQMENYGLPNLAEYSVNRPPGFEKGVEYNAWLEYEWDTVLEFCLMMLETERYAGKDISNYIPFIESCLRFFDEHYRYLAKKRGIRQLDGNGHLILYPGSGAETYKMAYNATSTIAALKTIATRLLELPNNYLGEQKRKSLDSLLKRIPPISFASFNGHPTIAPAKMWERINNVESTQLYPVFPWGIYGVGLPGLDTAINTWKYDTNVIKFRSHVGWKQDNIFAARLGLTQEAAKLALQKLENSGRRFPAFWGPGFDWTPDHNWGGSGMIGLQEMLLQTVGKKIYLFPAWPADWDVHFKLHAPYETTVEAEIKNGKMTLLKVVPESRRQDIVNMLPQ